MLNLASGTDCEDLQAQSFPVEMLQMKTDFIYWSLLPF